MPNVKTTWTKSNVIFIKEVAGRIVCTPVDRGDTVEISDAQQTLLEAQDSSAWGPQAIAITSITPDSAQLGEDNVITVRGTGFTADTVVRIDGEDLETTYVDKNTLTVNAVPAASALSAGDVDITAADVVGETEVESAAAVLEVLDVTAPTVLSTSPVNGATGVSASVHPSVTFSEAMDPATITSASVSIRDSIGDAVAITGSPALSVGNTVVTLTPAAPLTAGATYKLRVTTAAEDAIGNALASQYQQATGFTVAP